jgi:hypothetical protein
MPAFGQHFVLTIGRSGSNTLVNALNQHPQVLNYGEVLGDWNTIRKLYNRLPAALTSGEATYLDALLHNSVLARSLNGYRNLSYLRRGGRAEMKRFGRLRTIGVKEFSLNLRRRGLSDYLAQRPHIRVIGLQRSDVLDRFMSWKMLQQTGVVKLDRGGQTGQGWRRRIQLDTGSLLEELRTVRDESRELAALLDALPGERVCRIDYDAFYGSDTETGEILQRVFRFLDLPAFRPSLRMSKILKGDRLARIGNLDACRAALRDTEFADLLAG